MNHIVITTSFTHRDKSLMLYLNDIKRYPLLSAAEQDNLARIMKKGGKEGSEARRKLIECNLRFAVSVAKKYETEFMPLLDLINDANIGLCDACDSFDPDHGVNFISYAVIHMQKVIMADFEKHGRHIRLPHDACGSIMRYNEFADKVYAAEQRMPTIEEFAEHMGCSYNKAANILEQINGVTSLDEPCMHDGNSTTIGEMVFVESATTDYLEAEYDRTVVNTTLREVLNDDDYRIIQAVYGLLGDNGPSVSTLSMQLGLTESAVKKRCQRSLERIRKNPKAMDEFRQLLAA